MNRYQMFLVAVMASFFTVLTIVLSWSGSVLAQQAEQSSLVSAKLVPQQISSSVAVTESVSYVSVSAMAFLPLQQTASYSKSTALQSLSLNSSSRNFVAGSNVFVAPLSLPDHSRVLNLTLFGQDADKQGAIWLRLKRCDHNQLRCVVLTELTSTDVYALGLFEVSAVSFINEVVDNYLYSYFLESQLTAVGNSGLRAVRLAMVDEQVSAQSTNVEKWSLNGLVRSFTVPNSSATQLRICTDDLSRLSNSTHYPRLVVDGKTISLSSKECVAVWGSKIEIQRALNAGDSSGTYQFLR